LNNYFLDNLTSFESYCIIWDKISATDSDLEFACFSQFLADISVKKNILLAGLLTHVDRLSL